MIAYLARFVSFERKQAAQAVAAFADARANIAFAVQYIHSVANVFFNHNLQQFKTLYKTSSLSRATMAGIKSSRCIHEA